MMLKSALIGSAMAAALFTYAVVRVPIPERIEVEQPQFDITWNEVAGPVMLKSASLRDTAPKPIVTEVVLPPVIATQEELTPKLKRKLVTYRPTKPKKDVCQRHGMHKKYYGKRWRCKR